jgi:hypothetical protein
LLEHRFVLQRIFYRIRTEQSKINSSLNELLHYVFCAQIAKFETYWAAGSPNSPNCWHQERLGNAVAGGNPTRHHKIDHDSHEHPQPQLA